MKVARLLALLLIFTYAQAALFGEDPEIAKRRKRVEDEKAQKRSGKPKKTQQDKIREKKEKQAQGYLWNSTP
jgi:hypothetical protein